MDQDDWVQRLKPGALERDAAIAELRTILVRGLHRSLARQGGGDVFAQDVAQDALVQILNNLDQFEGKSKFTTWAMAIAVRLAISELRRKHFQDVSLDQIVDDGGIPSELAPDSGLTPEQALERQALVNQLRKLIQERLTEKQRIVIQAALNEIPIDTIAEQLNSNRNAVYKLLYDARQKLKQGFEANGISSSDIDAALS